MLTCLVRYLYTNFFFPACDGGGDRTDMSGQLRFLRGPKPNERECEWTIGDSGSPAGSHVIVNTYYNSEDCG